MRVPWTLRYILDTQLQLKMIERCLTKTSSYIDHVVLNPLHKNLGGWNVIGINNTCQWHIFGPRMLITTCSQSCSVTTRFLSTSTYIELTQVLWMTKLYVCNPNHSHCMRKGDIKVEVGYDFQTVNLFERDHYLILLVSNSN